MIQNIGRTVAILAFCTLSTLLMAYFVKLERNNSDKILWPSNNHHFDLDKPERIIDLDYRLDEISGLEMTSEGFILAVQDEKGWLFTLNPQDGTIISKYKFGHDGDYEGIASSPHMIFALQSDGDIFQFNQTFETKKFETDLSQEQDTEGLCYDSSLNALLVACKGRGYKYGERTKDHTINIFDLERRKILSHPLVVLEDVINDQIETKEGKKIKFAPSGLAINPKTNTLFVISSPDHLMIEMDFKENEILDVYKLGKKRFPQPEGICFSNDGTLFISNEGEPASLLVFKWSQ